MLQPAVNACSGTLYDSGGPTASYPNNANQSLLLCPDVPGMAAQLQFTTFALSFTNSIEMDALRIHDGPDAHAPLIGIYKGNSLANAVVTAGPLNPSGCLFLVFTSDGSGTGDLAATISCVAQCTPPTAVLANAGDTVIICPNTLLELDFGGSEAAVGQTLQGVQWRNLSAHAGSVGTWPQVGLVFDQTGIYQLHGQVVDDTGCGSHLVSFTAVVTPEARFTGTTAPAAACSGTELSLLGQAHMDSMVFTTLLERAHNPPLLLPDAIGVSFNSHMVVQGQPEGSQVTDPGDLGDICVTMEHSHLGDILMRLHCPNGQSVMLHQQGGGTTDLGIPVESNATPDLVGTCWTYCFSATPQFGRWDESCATCPSPNVVMVGNSPTLLPGTYTPVGSLNDLIGCPLNGVWTLEFIDLGIADNGHLCSWSMSPTTSPDSSFIHLTPGLNLLHPDSVSWSGTGVVAGIPPSLATGLATIPGQESYGFSVVDQHGCVHDTTLTITIHPSPLVEAGPSVVLCNGTDTLNGSVEVLGQDTCDYSLLLFDAAGDGWNGGANLVVRIGGVNTTYTLTGGTRTILLQVITGQELILNYTAGTVWNNENSFALYDHDLELLYASPLGPATGSLYSTTVSCGESVASGISWWPTTGLADPTSATTVVEPPANGWYYLNAINNHGCSAQDSVLVSVGGTPVFLTFDVGADALCLDPAPSTPVTWFLHGEPYTTTDENCLSEAPFGLWSAETPIIAECPSLSPVFAYCPTITITLAEGQLNTSAGLGTYTWRLNGDIIAEGPQASIASQGLGTYSVTVAMEHGCVVEATLLVDLEAALSMENDHGAVLQVIPNPNTGHFRVRMPGGGVGSILLLDMAGRVVLQQPLVMSTDGRSEPLAVALHAGVYVVEVRLGSTLQRTRMVVE